MRISVSLVDRRGRRAAQRRGDRPGAHRLAVAGLEPEASVMRPGSVTVPDAAARHTDALAAGVAHLGHAVGAERLLAIPGTDDIAGLRILAGHPANAAVQAGDLA